MPASASRSQTSASPARSSGRAAVRFWNTTNGKKAVMAASGVALSVFVAGHLAGNLQIFLGPDVFNAYARSLHDVPALVWSVRAVLVAMVTLHIWSAVQLAWIKREARPVGYVRRAHVNSTYASRTMYWSGPLLAAFIAYHLAQLTFGAGGTPFNPDDVYGNVIAAFQVPAVSGFYILSMGLLCFHLRHGLASMMQTLGFHDTRHTRRIKTGATLAAWIVFLGFSSIPLAIVAGLIPRIL